MPMIQRPSQPAPFIAEILPQFDDLGFVDSLPRTRALLAEFRRTAALARAPNVRRVSEQVHAQVYHGRMAAEDATAQIAAAEVAAAQAAPHKRDVGLELSAMRVPMWATLSEEVESWHALAQKKFVETLAIFEAAVGSIPEGVDSDKSAVNVGGKALQAWSDARAALERLQRLHSLAGNLRANGVLSVAGGPKAFGFSPLEYCWREPERLLQWNRGGPHEIFVMQSQIARGAQPAMLSAADLEALADQDKWRAADEALAQRTPRGRTAVAQEGS